MKKLKRSPKKSLMPDIAPLLDIMFMLLIFFLLTSTYSSSVMNINLPQSKITQSAVSSQKKVVISLNKDNQIFFNGKVISEKMLQQKIEQIMTKDSQQKIILEIDQNLPFQKFVNLSSLLKNVGAKNIAIRYDETIKK